MKQGTNHAVKTDTSQSQPKRAYILSVRLEIIRRPVLSRDEQDLVKYQSIVGETINAWQQKAPSSVIDLKMRSNSEKTGAERARTRTSSNLCKQENNNSWPKRHELRKPSAN